MKLAQSIKPVVTHAAQFQTFPPLSLETRTHVETECAAYHLKPTLANAQVMVLSGQRPDSPYPRQTGVLPGAWLTFKPY